MNASVFRKGLAKPFMWYIGLDPLVVSTVMPSKEKVEPRKYFSRKCISQRKGVFGEVLKF